MGKNNSEKDEGKNSVILNKSLTPSAQYFIIGKKENQTL